MGPPTTPRRPRRAPPIVAAGDRPEYLRRALAEYRARRYFEAHERLEDLWRDEMDPVRRRCLQGLLQIAAAMHKLVETGSTTAAAHLLERARTHLKEVPEGTAGVEVARVRDDAERAKAEIERLGAMGRSDLDESLVPRIDESGVE